MPRARSRTSRSPVVRPRPVVGEVIFADALARVHARRWTNRQSAYSAVNDATGAVLIVAEAMHASGRLDIPRLTEAVAAELQAFWSVSARVHVLSERVASEIRSLTLATPGTGTNHRRPGAIPISESRG